MKSVLIVMHDFAGIIELFKANLAFLDYKNVDFLVYADEQFKYKSTADRLHQFFRKTFLRDKTYKEQLRKVFIEETLINKAKNLRDYDVIVVLNTDFFSDNFLKILKSKAKKLVGNHWDGLSRTPHIIPLIDNFNAFYVFDKADADSSKNITFLPNFYFDFPEVTKFSEIKQDIYYLGTFVQQRFDILKKISDEAKRQNLSQKIQLFSWEKQLKNGEINFTNSFTSFKENIINVQESRALIDLKLKDHNGLSFRFFEAMKLEKKIITDNTSVKDYDFFDPENIFILQEKSLENIGQFVKSPYKKISQHVTEKYSFKYWFNTLIS